LETLTSSISTIGTQVVMGICSSSSNSASITGNMVAGLYNAYANIFSGQIRGIITYDGVNTITGNTVQNFFTTSADANSDTSSSLLGISQSSGQAGQTVSGNNVHSLVNAAGTAAVTVIGIYFAGPVSGTNVVARNLVHSLSISSTNTGSTLTGMYFGAGSFTVQNNMVRVGLGSGGSTARYSLIFGMCDSGSTAGRNFHHNSVYIGGTQTIPVQSFTTAFFNNNAGNVRAFQNNIFLNARNMSGGTGKPYAVRYFSTNLAGLTAGGNLFLASGTGGVLGRSGGTECATLAAWQAATGQDAGSLAGDPLFINPTGTVTDLNLHLSSNSPAINAGLPLGVTDDFDDDLRSTTTPTIGADEYIADYTLVPGYNQLTALSFGGGTNVLGFQGLPTFNYALEMATNLAAPIVWQPQWTNNAAANGKLLFTNITSPSQVFYRAHYVP
jgi:trimeric autotransporter adhesin